MIEAAVIVRIFVQFLGQIFALHLVHTTRPDIRLPFRMWLYPLPSLVAACGWLFVLGSKLEHMTFALAVFGSGAAVYPLWRRWQGGAPPESSSQNH